MPAWPPPRGPHGAGPCGRRRHGPGSRIEVCLDQTGSRQGMSLLLRAGALDRPLADLHPGRLGLGGLRNPDLENAVLELRVHLPGVDPLREGERTREAAERPLDAVITLALLLGLGLALARNREHVVLDLDVDVILGHAGQITAQNEV